MYKFDPGVKYISSIPSVRGHKNVYIIYQYDITNVYQYIKIKQKLYIIEGKCD